LDSCGWLAIWLPVTPSLCKHDDGGGGGEYLWDQRCGECLLCWSPAFRNATLLWCAQAAVALAPPLSSLCHALGAAVQGPDIVMADIRCFPGMEGGPVFNAEVRLWDAL
jgi:hypothetical protein